MLPKTRPSCRVATILPGAVAFISRPLRPHAVIRGPHAPVPPRKVGTQFCVLLAFVLPLYIIWMPMLYFGFDPSTSARTLRPTAAAGRDGFRPQSNAKPGGVLFVNVVCGWQIYRLVGFKVMPMVMAEDADPAAAESRGAGVRRRAPRPRAAGPWGGGRRESAHAGFPSNG